jgi:hypothetical protein
MKKQAYEIDSNGYIKEIHVVDCNEQGIPLQLLPNNVIAIHPPDGLYRAKWTGTEWIEDMPQEEIDALNAPTQTEPTIEEYLVDIDFRVAMIELGL